MISYATVDRSRPSEGAKKIADAGIYGSAPELSMWAGSDRMEFRRKWNYGAFFYMIKRETSWVRGIYNKAT